MIPAMKIHKVSYVTDRMSDGGVRVRTTSPVGFIMSVRDTTVARARLEQLLGPFLTKGMAAAAEVDIPGWNASLVTGEGEASVNIMTRDEIVSRAKKAKANGEDVESPVSLDELSEHDTQVSFLTARDDENKIAVVCHQLDDSGQVYDAPWLLRTLDETAGINPKPN